MESVPVTTNSYIHTRAEITSRIFKGKLDKLINDYELNKLSHELSVKIYNDKINQANLIIEEETKKKTIKDKKKVQIV